MRKRKIERPAADSNGLAAPQIKKSFHVNDLISIQPMTENQHQVFDVWQTDPDTSMFLCGSAGTGKTFVALYLSLLSMLDKNTPYDKIVIVRSAVQCRDIGHLPGDLAEKTAVYEQPYVEICDEVFKYKNAYDNLKKAGRVEFATSSFMRGITFNNAIVIVDECQNMTFQELSTIITRIGTNSKIVFCGDSKQVDLTKNYDKSGFKLFKHIIDAMQDYFFVVEFDCNDIVRSSLVKQFIITCEGMV